MKKPFLCTLGLTVLIAVSVFSSCSNSKKEQPDNITTVNMPTNEDLIKEGERLVMVMGCHDCHSPKKVGAEGPEIITELMLSGYPSDRPLVKFDSPLIKEGFPMMYPDLTAAAGPWGVSFGANLTPDETGIGNWTEAQFKKAVTQGKSKGLDGSRPLLPPMPWMNYKTLTDDEIHTIFTYLKSIKPVNNIVPNPIAPDVM